MAGGGGVSTGTAYDVDQEQLSSFMQSEQGKQYSDSYNPNNSYAKVGDSLQSYDPKKIDSSALGLYRTVGQDVGPMLTAFQQWMKGNAQTQTNWQNYASAVNANEGGQGDNTITGGAAQGQRQVLLGALANAGNPTSPTPGLGSMGTLMKNGKPIRMGEVIK